MSNISIFEKSWIDLVFEDRNQAYGAYQLRRENPKTTLKAMCYAVLLLTSIAGALTLLSSFGEKPFHTPVIDSPPVVVTTYHVLPTPEPERPKAQPAATVAKPEDPDRENLTNPTVVTPEEANQNINTNKEAAKPTAAEPGQGDGPVVSNPLPGGGGGSGSGTEGTGKDDGPMNTAVVDRKPQFPGGIDRFYMEVGNRFRKPSLDSESVKSIRIFVSFVIEKDGTLTDVKVLNNPEYNLDKEALRVLRSMKTKWEPGLYKGQPVRTLYTLPITVKIN